MKTELDLLFIGLKHCVKIVTHFLIGSQVIIWIHQGLTNITSIKVCLRLKTCLLPFSSFRGKVSSKGHNFNKFS